MSKITITFPDGNSRQYDQGVTGLQVAESISKGLAGEALAVEVNGEVWDLNRKISSDAALKILKWQDDGGKYAFWHSSAHLMAAATEQLFPGTKFGIGPPIEVGFYYDLDIGDHTLTAEDLQKIGRQTRATATTWMTSARSTAVPITTVHATPPIA